MSTAPAEADLPQEEDRELGELKEQTLPKRFKISSPLNNTFEAAGEKTDGGLFQDYLRKQKNMSKKAPKTKGMKAAPAKD